MTVFSAAVVMHNDPMVPRSTSGPPQNDIAVRDCMTLLSGWHRKRVTLSPRLLKTPQAPYQRNFFQFSSYKASPAALAMAFFSFSERSFETTCLVFTGSHAIASSNRLPGKQHGLDIVRQFPEMFRSQRPQHHELKLKRRKLQSITPAPDLERANLLLPA